MNHQFNIYIAKIYGVDEAILLNNLVFWQAKNQANRKHEYDGRYWTYNSMRAFSELFPYWTEKQIRRILINLEERNCIKSANYNKIGYDRTKWYSVEPLILDICLNGQMDLTKQADGFDQMGEPIPDSKPDCNKDNKDTTSEFIRLVLEHHSKLQGLPQANKITDARRKTIGARIKDYGYEEVINILDKANESQFLIDSKKTNWYNFDWIYKPNNFVKIYECNYDNKPHKTVIDAEQFKDDNPFNNRGAK